MRTKSGSKPLEFTVVMGQNNEKGCDRMKCKEMIVFGDDEGDNSCTFHCQKNERHSGHHIEEGVQYGKKYVLIWRDKNE